MANNKELLAEVLEKMIDSQISNTEALTGLKEIVEESSGQVKEINGYFTNGFRAEIKQYISDELKRHIKPIQEGIEKIDDLEEAVNSYKKVSFWAKIIVAFMVAIGTIVVGVVKILAIIP